MHVELSTLITNGDLIRNTIEKHVDDITSFVLNNKYYLKDRLVKEFLEQGIYISEEQIRVEIEVDWEMEHFVYITFDFVDQMFGETIGSFTLSDPDEKLLYETFFGDFGFIEDEMK